MNNFIFIVLVIVLIFMILQNVKLFKRSKHVKNYVRCSDAIFDDSEDKVAIIKNYIEEETDQEFKNKGRVLLVYAELATKEDPSETLKALDIRDTFQDTKEKFDAQKFEYNSDTYFWLVLDMIKAHSLNDEKTIEGLLEVVNKHYDFIKQDLVVSLFYSIHHALADDDKKDLGFLRDLWNGNYPSGCTYDKRLVGFYKYLAVSVLAKVNEELTDEMVGDLDSFSHMKAGQIAMRDLGIYDKYHSVKKDDDEDLDLHEDIEDISEKSEDTDAPDIESEPADEASTDDK